jgi:hypothetical protein
MVLAYGCELSSELLPREAPVTMMVLAAILGSSALTVSDMGPLV